MKTIFAAILILASVVLANDPNSVEPIPYQTNRTVEEVIVDICKHIDPNSTVCDVGSAEGGVMTYFAKHVKAVKGVERNTASAANSRKRKDSKGRLLDVVSGNVLKTGFPIADVYYIWIERSAMGPIVEKIETDDIKKIFIMGHHTDYITIEFFKARGMIPHTVRTWQGDFTYWIWDRR